MQLLFEGSEEADTDCLGMIEAGFARSSRRRPAGARTWAGASWRSAADESACCSGDYLYFAHSFACDTGPATVATATTAATSRRSFASATVSARSSTPNAQREAGGPLSCKSFPLMIIYPGDGPDGRARSCGSARAVSMRRRPIRSSQRRAAQLRRGRSRAGRMSSISTARVPGQPVQHELIAALARRDAADAAGRRRHSDSRACRGDARRGRARGS